MDGYEREGRCDVVIVLPPEKKKTIVMLFDRCEILQVWCFATLA